MEVKDWTPEEKESFTTPGGTFRRPTGSGRTYSFERAPAGAENAVPQPEARTGRVSPFSREAGAQPWYAGVEAGAAAAPVIVSHDGEAQGAIPGAGQGPVYAVGQGAAAYTVQTPIPGGPNIYTIQLPAAPRQAAPQRQSLWWVPVALVVVLVLGILLGTVLSPLLSGRTTPTAAPTPSSSGSGSESYETAAVRIYRENLESVVGITAYAYIDPTSASYTPPSAGTGFVISEDGYVLTNAHVVSGAASIQVELSDGQKLLAELVGLEEGSSDVALLRVRAEGLRPVSCGDSDSLNVGDWVCTIGNPLGELNFSLTAGCLSSGPRRISTGGRTLTMLQFDAAINKGNSGGPLFDAAGKVIGVVTAKLAGNETDGTVEGLGFALPINAVLDLARGWMSGTQSDS